MKVSLTKKGWDEVTTSHIEVASIPRSAIHSVEVWNSFNKRHPGIGRNRQVCNCCRLSWKNLKGYVNLIFTNKGNKAVCDDCLSKLKEAHEN